jgi:DNA primase
MPRGDRTFDILSIAQELGLDLVHTGNELACVCPIHGDSNPSLYVNESKGLWYCFACQKGGSAPHLVSFITGMSMADSYNWLEERFDYQPIVGQVVSLMQPIEFESEPFMIAELLRLYHPNPPPIERFYEIFDGD